MDLIKPKALKKGDTIGVFAPSSIVNPEVVQNAEKYLISQGYKVKVHLQTFYQNGNHAGTDQDKINALHDLFQDDDVDIIFCARGGNGLLQYIDNLDYTLIAKNPKAVIGFSDVTALHHALLNKIGLVSFHGPIFQHIGTHDVFKDTTAACLDMISGGWKNDNLLGLSDKNIDGYPITVIKQGKTEGRLIGGNLTLLSELTKTSYYCPDFEGNIVFFEDTQDYAYKHDRQLASLFLNNAFKKVAGIIIGITKIDPNESAGDYKHPRHTIKDIITYYTKDINIPVVINASITHGQPNQTIPQGIRAQLDTTTDQPTLKLLESPFLL